MSTIRASLTSARTVSAPRQEVAVAAGIYPSRAPGLRRDAAKCSDTVLDPATLIGLASSVVQADVADGQPMMLGVNLAGSHAGCAPPVALVLPSPALLGLDLQGVFVDTVIQTDGLTKQ